MSLTTCLHQPTPTTSPKPPVPTRPVITWQDDGDRVSIPKEEAVALAKYFNEIDAYIAKVEAS